MEGPLAVFEVRLIEHLRSVGYAPETVIRKLRVVGKLSRFLSGEVPPVQRTVGPA